MIDIWTVNNNNNNNNIIRCTHYIDNMYGMMFYLSQKKTYPILNDYQH